MLDVVIAGWRELATPKTEGCGENHGAVNIGSSGVFGFVAGDGGILDDFP